MKYKKEIAEIIEYLNTKANRNYKKDTKSTIELICYHLDKGYKVEDFKTVIDLKVSQWLHIHEMKGYLRPQTLFGWHQFPKYLKEYKYQKEHDVRRNETIEVKLE